MKINDWEWIYYSIEIKRYVLMQIIVNKMSRIE